MSNIPYRTRSVHDYRINGAIGSAAAAQALRAVATALKSGFVALFDGLVAYRGFEHLTSWGTPTDTAARKALGAGETK